MSKSFCLLMAAILATQPCLLADSEAFLSSSRLSPDPSKPQPQLRNVELTAQGLLNVQVIDSAGYPIPDVAVLVRVGDQVTQQTSDSQGRLTPAAEHGGLVVMQIGDSVYACRAWRHQTAPPSALPSIGIIDDRQPVVRGNRRQRGHGVQDCCPPEQRTGRLESRYGIAILALGATAGYFALSRDNASD
ncbi:MAG: hypothetical protein R3C59_12630 [Planctomycetaceae bacterium]